MRHLFLLVAALLIWSLQPQPLFPAENDGASINAYADYLFKQGEYYRAITEYKRYLYFYSDGAKASDAQLSIGLSYMYGGSYQEAVDYWKGAIGKQDGLRGHYLEQGKVLLAMSYFDLHNERPFSAKKSMIEEGLAVLESLDASESNTASYREFVGKYKLQEQELPYKSSALAGTLSAILPGAGSAYNGRYIEASYVFFFTGLFLYATLDSHRTGQNGYVPIFGFFTLAFYGGGIYTAINGTERFNSELDGKLFHELRSSHGLILPDR